jgi:Zn finger protein HypA/HybF involved in hydrogenase expression
MATTHGHIECSECGTLIDTAADTPNSFVPCPKCGGTKRTVQLTAGGDKIPAEATAAIWKSGY